MGWFSSSLCKSDLRVRLALALVALSTMFAGWICAGQNEGRYPPVGEGCLLYKSPIAGRFEPVPLIHTHAKVDVRGLVASATVTQQYANSSDAPIEAVYIFPLPHDAAVYDLEIRIGDRVIRSVIHEREQAKRLYQAAKAEGKRAALLEQERPNVFTASVANIMPNDQISVRVRYVQPLKWEDGRMRLVFPMVAGPRYIPGTQEIDHAGSGWAADTNAVPDASRITPVVRNPEGRPGHDISVSVDLDTGFEAAAVKSVSHEVNVRRLGDGRQHVELVGGTTLPNKDFVLEIRQAESTETKTALFLSSGGDSGETHFLLTAFPPTVRPSERMPVEMLYMIDVSGSMQGTSIEQARAALLQALDRLRPNDRFGILEFNNGYQEFAPWPMAASAQKRGGRTRIRGKSAGRRRDRNAAGAATSDDQARNSRLPPAHRAVDRRRFRQRRGNFRGDAARPGRSAAVHGSNWQRAKSVSGDEDGAIRAWDLDARGRHQRNRRTDDATF
jgi:hypothetical protein